MINKKPSALRGAATFGRGMDLLNALNAVAALQRSATSEDEIINAFRQEVTKIGLRSGLSLFDESGDFLTMRAVAYPDHIIDTLEKLTGLEADNLKFAIADVDLFRQVMKTGESVYVVDNSSVIVQMLPKTLKSYVETVVKAGGGSPAIFAPLIIGQQCQGVLTVMGAGLIEDDIPVFNACANHVAIAIEHARTRAKLEQEENIIRRRNRQLELLNRIMAASTAGLAWEGVLEMACRELARSFDIPLAVAALFNKNKTAATTVAEYRAEGQLSALNLTFVVARSPECQYLLTHKAPLIINNTLIDPRLGSVSVIRHHQIVSLLLVPLIINDEVIGGLGLGAFEPNRFSSDDINLAWNVADQIAGVLAHTRLTDEYRRLIAAVEQTADSVLITNINGEIIYVNPTFERVSGYGRAEIIGKNSRILKSDRHDEAFYQDMWNTISAGRVWRGRIIDRKKDGTLYTSDSTITPVRDEDGAILNYVNVRRDVTRELEIEEQYHQAQRMESLGQLTAGIAHDFNNLLTVINGFAELIRYQILPDNPLYEMVEKVSDSGQRAANLVRQLLAFSRKQVMEPELLNLNEIVTDMEKMLGRIIGENIKMSTNLSPKVWLVKVDPVQIEQVIMNLVVNARDAMLDGGQLTIETANVVLDDDYAAGHFETEPGEHVVLTVSDTGQGMSKEIQTRIFEPFFTTKEQGKGTGLGLATVHGVVKQSGGNIWVYSEEGLGTTFKIYLPRAHDETAILRSEANYDVILVGHETILLVEDDEDVRNLTRRVLQNQGYTLLEAQDAQEALHLSVRYSGPIHLLLTDVVMPGVNGKNLADQLKETHPEINILFMSGYTDNAIAHHGVLEPGVAFLQKPLR